MTARRILVLVPHPDDEVVGCAAAIQRARRDGAKLFSLYLTTGVPPADALWPWLRPGYEARVARRRSEALAVAAELGIEPLHFAPWPSRTLKAQLVPALAEIRAALRRCVCDALWVSAWEGAHQDHDVANFLAARTSEGVPVTEYAEYNYAGAVLRSQAFPCETGSETVLTLTPAERAGKRRLLALYASERGNLAHVRAAIETLRPLPPHDYGVPPHHGRLFRERFHWVPFRHPRIDFEPTGHVLATLARF
jgi:N-acetylglucosamine malate deacetylase 1